MARLVFLLALFGCLFSCFGVEAQTAASDGDKLKACIEAAEKAQKSGMGCAGSIADPCIANARNGPESGPAACAKRELVVWEALLQTALQGINKSGFKELVASVQQSQTQWSASREKLCPNFGQVDPGMAVGGPDYCRLIETAGRALTLRKLAAALQEH